MDPSRIYHHLNLLPTSNFIDPRLVPKSPFRFILGNGTSNGKTTDDERLALLDRFRAEGLDVRKINDAQKLPFVWRWLVDAEINCQSLRHQIEKMRMQHDEELQEVEDYIEQVWKLSTERLILLEEENKCLREKQDQNKALVKTRRYSTDNNNEDGDADEEDAEDSDIELEKCLYGGKTYSKGGLHRRPSILVDPNGTAAATTKLISGPGRNNNGNHLVNSSSTSSLASSVSMSAGLNLCDSLKMRSSRSAWQLATNGNQDESVDSKRAKTPTNYCEKCEMLDADLLEMRQKCVELESALDDANEKNFVLDKLNRSIEMENENFAYKLAEAEDRSNQLERRILLLEKECRHQQQQQHLKSNGSSPVDVATSGLGAKLVHAPNDQSTRRLIEELNHKVKQLEEELDHRLMMYEDLEMKYEKQKVKQHETLWKLRKFMQDKDLRMASNGSEATLSSLGLEDLLLLEEDKALTSSSNDSGLMVTMDPIGPHIHHRPRHRAQSIHDKLV